MYHAVRSYNHKKKELNYFVTTPIYCREEEKENCYGGKEVSKVYYAHRAGFETKSEAKDFMRERPKTRLWVIDEKGGQLIGYQDPEDGFTAFDLRKVCHLAYDSEAVQELEKTDPNRLFELRWEWECHPDFDGKEGW